MKALSCTASCVIGPSTCGAIPMKLAKTSASSVRGYLLVSPTTNSPVIKAPAMMEMLTILPRCWRFGSTSLSGIAPPFQLTKKHEPERESKKCRQARVHEDERRKLRLEFDADKKQPRGDGEQDAEDPAQYPGGEKRP